MAILALIIGWIGWIWSIWVLGIVVVATLLATLAAVYYFLKGRNFTSQQTMKIVRASVLWPILVLLVFWEKENPLQTVAKMKDW